MQTYKSNAFKKCPKCHICMLLVRHGEFHKCTVCGHVEEVAYRSMEPAAQVQSKPIANVITGSTKE